MNGTQRAMYGAFDPLAWRALADSYGEEGDTKSERYFRGFADFGDMFFDIVDACYPKSAIKVGRMDRFADVFIYATRTMKRIAVELVRGISESECERRCWYITPRDAVVIVIDYRGMFPEHKDRVTLGMRLRLRQKMDEMWAFITSKPGESSDAWRWPLATYPAVELAVKRGKVKR